MSNHYRFTLNVNDQEINIPIEIKFDMEGRDQGVESFENEIIQDIINGVDVFEITRNKLRLYS